MASAKLYDFSGTLKGTVELPETLFGAPVNKAVLYDSVRQYLANQRRGTSKAKGRSDVSYSTKKPYRQKGTGRARAGMRSSPIWRHGGVVFGPHPRDYHYAIPRKMKRIALVSALSDKGVRESVVLVEGVAVDKPKTKPFASFLQAAGLGGKRVLFVTEARNEAVYRSIRNIPGIDVIEGRNMNAYGILRAEVLLITKEGLSSLEGVFAK
ncbi:MAG: 50S ribosomal protein L4 [Candidatus Krumholzibacteria bacterium]|nr:50S ribosomal protein L4 [Candidatus Krumholzibacteria bacterium]